MAHIERTAGQTTIGSDRQASCSVAVNTKAGTASGLRLVDTAGVEYILWVNSSGVLKISSTVADFTTNPNSAGTTVGGQ